jgi:hypothetical protein
MALSRSARPKGPPVRNRLLATLAALSVLTLAAPVAGSLAGHSVDHHCKGCPTAAPGPKG